MPEEKARTDQLPVVSPLSPVERAVARKLQGDIPLARRPFAAIADDLGLDEQQVLTAAESLKAGGVIRKLGAIVRHQLAGYRHNVMVLWAVPPAQCDAAGKTLAAYPEVTHCYQRRPAFAGKYPLFTMVHFKGEADAARLEKMAATAGASEFKVLRSVEEFKKTSMEFF